jgi:uncharacterized protein YoaH (UPF0181 family)
VWPFIEKNKMGSNRKKNITPEEEEQDFTLHEQLQANEQKLIEICAAHKVSSGEEREALAETIRRIRKDNNDLANRIKLIES